MVFWAIITIPWFLSGCTVQSSNLPENSSSRAISSHIIRFGSPFLFGIEIDRCRQVSFSILVKLKTHLKSHICIVCSGQSPGILAFGPGMYRFSGFPANSRSFRMFSRVWFSIIRICVMWILPVD